MQLNKSNKEMNDNIQVVYIESPNEKVSKVNTFLVTLLICIGLYVFIPDVKTLINPWFKWIQESINKSVTTKPLNNTKSEVIHINEERKRNTNKSTGNTTITVANLFINDTSIGSRFIGMAEGNYQLSKSGTYSNSANYYGHEEPSKAVPDNTINRGFCSTPINTSGLNKEQKVTVANTKCLDRLNKLLQKAKSKLQLGNSIDEPKLSLLLNAIDLGNQARTEVHENMLNIQIPKMLEEGKSLTLADITIMRRDSFYSKETKRLKSALGTISGLRKAAILYCGNDLESNIIAVDQARRVEASNKALNKIGMGLPPMTRKQIMNNICVKKVT